MSSSLINYYARRAYEYEKIYSKPERQEDLNKLIKYLQAEFKDTYVYEAACGTGYWTQFISETAKSIYASDINDEVLDIAKQKQYVSDNISFHKENIFEPRKGKKFNSFFGGFIWSHVPVVRIDEFLNSVESRVENGGKIIFIDNNYVEGSSTPVTYKDDDGNTYQVRKLEDGSEYTVLKNFPDEEYLTECFAKREKQMEFLRLKYFWIVKYFR